MGNCDSKLRTEAIVNKKGKDYNKNEPDLFFEKIDQHITKVSKSICKIEIETGEGIKTGIGFLIKFLISF